jgi:hypothetical protein
VTTYGQLHGSTEGLRRPSRGDPMAPIGKVSRIQPGQRDYGETATHHQNEPCHVFIATEAGRYPGLLLEWRKPHQLPWEGHVVHARIRDGRWVKVDEWVLAGSVEKA